MIHARKDYHRIQDPALHDRNLLGAGCTAIGEDEPVFLLRAKDKLFMQMLVEYYTLLEDNVPGSREMMTCVSDHMKLTHEWQQKNETKNPDLPK